MVLTQKPDADPSLALATWSGNQPVYGWKTEFPVAMAGMDGVLYGVYLATNGKLYFIQSNDGVNWLGDDAILVGGNNLESDQPPALTAKDGVLYLVYKQSGGHEMYLATWNGSWSGNDKIVTGGQGDTPETDCGPALCYFPNIDMICLVYQGKNSAKMYQVTYEPSGWWNNLNMQDADGNDLKCDAWPALAYIDDKLYCAYQGSGGQDIYYASWDGTDEPITWKPNQAIQISRQGDASPQTDSGVALVPFNGNLWLFYRGADNSYIYEAALIGQNWRLNVEIASVSTINPQSSVSPGAAAFVPAGSETAVLSMLYPASDGSMQLYCATLQ